MVNLLPEANSIQQEMKPLQQRLKRLTRELDKVGEFKGGVPARVAEEMYNALDDLPRLIDMIESGKAL